MIPAPTVCNIGGHSPTVPEYNINHFTGIHRAFTTPLNQFY
jgi:hypothetical protein